jgi:hypothetical protein
MRKLVCFCFVCFVALGTTQSAWAIKQFQDRFKDVYAGEKANGDLKALVNDAKCNVCHVEKEDKKKVRNVYGKALHDALEKDEFPVAEFKKDPAKYADRLNEIFKKLEGEKSADEKHKTFGDRIKANLLPGGDKEGK